MFSNNRNKGFTLLELIVSIVVFLVVATIASAFLLHKIRSARVASISENIANIRTAIYSYTAKYGALQDTDGDGDYLDEIINKGLIDEHVNVPECSQWKLVKVTDQSSKEAFVIQVDYSNCPSSVAAIFQELDNKVDDGDPQKGNVRFTSS